MCRTKVKICGLTRAEDVAAAVEAGADAVGFVFAESPRRVSVDEVAGLAALVPEEVDIVGVFVDPTEHEVLSAVERCGLTLVQLCGSETPEFCDRVPLPVIKVVRVTESFRYDQVDEYVGHVDAVLLEKHVAGRAGGAGEIFDWEAVGPIPPGLPAFVAGGLSAENVTDCVRAMRPHGVDVSSGVEASPGVKDRDAIAAFIAAVRRADEEARS
jgi:phosphoribosylanthranilate isomerase